MCLSSRSALSTIWFLFSSFDLVDVGLDLEDRDLRHITGRTWLPVHLWENGKVKSFPTKWTDRVAFYFCFRSESTVFLYVMFSNGKSTALFQAAE